jgi:hypothetical protein
MFSSLAVTPGGPPRDAMAPSSGLRGRTAKLTHRPPGVVIQSTARKQNMSDPGAIAPAMTALGWTPPVATGDGIAAFARAAGQAKETRVDTYAIYELFDAPRVPA